jgi:hypothetical protein
MSALVKCGEHLDPNSPAMSANWGSAGGHF